MTEITIVSGKGGTGKTSVTAAFAKLAAKTDPSLVICDLDVDASDLHLLLSPSIEQTVPFGVGKVAYLDPDLCLLCGACETYCRFGAIGETDDGMVLDQERCEGCGVCAAFCRVGAIEMQPRKSGQWFRSKTDLGPMLHAELFPGEENSGLLVSRLREEAKKASGEGEGALIIADGPPGIGCPVISAVSGTDFVVIVTEPTVSGVHDLARIADLCAHFKRPVGVLLNKADLDPDQAAAAEAVCWERDIPILARIPFSPAVVRALLATKTLDQVEEDGIAAALESSWKAVRERAALAAPSTH